MLIAVAFTIWFYLSGAWPIRDGIYILIFIFICLLRQNIWGSLMRFHEMKCSQADCRRRVGRSVWSGLMNGSESWRREGILSLVLGVCPSGRFVQAAPIHNTGCERSQVCHVNVCMALIARTPYTKFIFHRIVASVNHLLCCRSELLEVEIPFSVHVLAVIRRAR